MNAKSSHSRARVRTPFLASLLAASLVAGVVLASVAPAPACAAEGAAKLVSDAGRKLREEDLTGALRLLEQAIESEPRNAEAHVLYQEIAGEVLGPAEIQTSYREKAAANADDPLFQYLATRLLDSEDALRKFDKQRLKFKGSPWPNVGRAKALADLGRLDEALKAHDDAISIAAGEPRFRAYQASTLERAGRWPAAVDAWRRVVEQKPKDLSAQIGLGEALRGAGNPAEAIEVFTAAQKLDISDPDPRYRIGLAHLDTGNFEEALKNLDAAIRLDGGMVEALCAASEAVLKQTLAKAQEGAKDPDEKQLDKSLEFAMKAVTANPDSVRAHFSLGAVYEAYGELDADQLETALEEYDAALEMLPFPGPHKVRVLVARAYVLLRLARWEEAETDARKALDIDPENVTAMLHAGHALCSVDNFEAAIKKYYKPALGIDKSDARVQYGLGMAYWNLNKLNDTKKMLEAAAKAEPDNGLYRLSLGELYYQLKRNKDAVTELFQATELRPKDPVAWTAYGRACCARDHWDDAIEAFEKVIKLEEEVVDEYLYLAIIYADHKKDKPQAREYIEEFMERGGNDPNLESWIEQLLEEDD